MLGQAQAPPRLTATARENLCCLQAAGFTISPLMSKYVRLAGGEESQESLVSEPCLLANCCSVLLFVEQQVPRAVAALLAAARRAW